MNIFKILSNGDGKIHEPSISAFLAYLLDPLESHGLRAELLYKLLDSAYKENNLRNLKFNVKVLLEQAFRKKEDERKSIVDIVILIYKNEVSKKEIQAKSLLASDKEKSNSLERIILIENKINDIAITKGQLQSQYNNAMFVLNELFGKEIEKKISFIFITPFESGEEEFEKFKENKSASHIYWNLGEEFEDGDENSSNNGFSISDLLKEILNDEGHGKIEAIDEYAKHTIKSFINFIDSGFRSRNKEKMGGEFKRDIWNQFGDFRKEYESQSLLTAEYWSELEEFLKKAKRYPEIKIRHSPNHIISIFVADEKRKDGKKIFSISKSGNKLIVHLVTRNHNITNAKISNEFSSYIKNIKKTHFELEYNKKTAFEIFKKHLEIIKDAN